jgi:very-short-patch-repair endonuclease
MRAGTATQHAEREVARVAAARHGVVSLRQLKAAGIGRCAVARRVAAGRLHPVHREVYAVGHSQLTREGQWLAAVLACGDGAALSHCSAAAHLGIRPQSSGPIEVTVPAASGRRSRPGILLHRSKTLRPEYITKEDGIPVTTPARTIADLRRVLPPDHLDAAIRRAEILRLDIGPQPGFEPDRAKSELERLVHRLCRRHRLPRPEQNVLVGKYEVDFLWREQRVIVEADSWEFHRTRAAFEADRRRDAELRLLGYDVLRVTHRQATYEAEWVAETVQALLDRSRYA